MKQTPRQYFTQWEIAEVQDRWKGMDLSNVHQNRPYVVARSLNERPRETLQFYSPAEKFAECVAAID